MKIDNIEIKNFKSIKREKLGIESLAIFVGANGSGKSNFLKALVRFYNPRASVEIDDFYDYQTAAPIEIIVTYGELSPEEIEHFSKYISGDKKLTVTKRFVAPNTQGKYYGKVLGCKAFTELQRSPVKKFQEQYLALTETPDYRDLPKGARTAAAMEDALKEWESNNQNKLEFIESENQFFGFENNSVSSLERFTKFVYIPAVLNEAQLEDTRNSPIGELTDILARQKLKEDEDIKKLQEEISRKFAEKLKPFNEGEMLDLSSGLTKTLQAYYGDVGVNISLDDLNTEIKLPPPKAKIMIKEGGHDAQISFVGQGLQRAFILSLLQYFAQNKAGPNGEDFNLILGIDEPELYQHPSKQKLFYKVLKSLTTSGSSVASSIQCLYTTHSPLMLDVGDFNQIIRVSKENIEGSPSETRIKSSDLAALAEEEARLPSRGKVFSDLAILSRMVNVIDSRVKEGFFSRAVVLVEGESDVVALKVAAEHHSEGSIDFDELDIPIISCSSKPNIEKPAIIFSLLGILTYKVWDSDKGAQVKLERLKKKHNEASEGADKQRIKEKIDAAQSEVSSSQKQNRDLLALNHIEPQDWPKIVSKTCAAFENNLEALLEEELGKEYMEGLVEKHNKKIQAKNPRKNPLVMTEVLGEAFSSGKKSKTLESIVSAIVKL